ncbi:GerAB/ArcD/ProY family transporter [Salipaludibacillus sp. HK11]|uniref:GerAB/ArcD/ProY family transporter n=1 Tax=Salipaludibacillus sp. HK11 TaxID=3394320 RepID=UPI0039FBDAB7
MKEEFSTIDYVILTYMLQSGIALFVLPRVVAENFSYNGWVVIPIISGLIGMQVILIGHTCKKMKRTSPFEVMNAALPKVLRYPIYLTLVVVWSVLGCGVGANYFQIVQMISFPNTPQYIFKAIIACVSFYIIVKGFANLVKGTVIFFMLTIWTLFTTFFVLQEFEFTRLTPFVLAGELNLLDGIFEILKSFLGFELFILFSTYIHKDINITKVIIYGHLFTTFVYTFVTFVAFGYFSLLQLKETQYPVIVMLDYVKVPFLERIDNLIFSVFFMKIIITVSAYYWSAKEAMKHIFQNSNEVFLTFIIVFGSFLLTFFLQTSREINAMIDNFALFAFIISILFPLLLLLLMKLNQSKSNEVRNHG